MISMEIRINFQYGYPWETHTEILLEKLKGTVMTGHFLENGAQIYII